MSYPYEEWNVTEEGFDRENLQKNESVFSLGNGFLGIRGNFEEGGPCGVRGSYLNGFYEMEKIKYGEIAYGYAQNSQTMLNVADGQIIRVELDGEQITLDTGEISDYRRTLSMKEGQLYRNYIWKSPGGKVVKVQVRRLVSFAFPHVAAFSFTITPVNCNGTLRIVSSIDGNVTNLTGENDPRVGSELSGNALKTSLIYTGKDWGALLQNTQNSELALCCYMVNRLNHKTDGNSIQDGSRAVCEYQLECRQNEEVTLEKVVAYTRGKTGDEGELLKSAEFFVWEAAHIGYSGLLALQKKELESFWRDAAISIQGDDALLQGLRFNMFHLLQSAGRDGKTNISAKGLTGEGYEGHYFWDTETYILPFFIHCRPEIAKNLLLYRYSIIDKARTRAREMGHPVGALFPWRTINGNECSAYYPAGTAQYHINADIAFAVKRYVTCTGDEEFLADYGAEILVETARLWFDLGFFNEHRNGAFCINCVTGPDEYNAIVDNNCYTNLMAQENLNYAVKALQLLNEKYPEKYEKLVKKLNIDEKEPVYWLRAANAMYIPKDDKTGLYLQDDGFLDRKPWALDTIPKENFPLLLHYHPLVIYRHQVCKQADLILAMFLLGDKFTIQEKHGNFDYYDKITTHDSSLSMATFSVMASELGYFEKAYDYFRGTARLDLDDTHNNTKDGLHMANMAGTWMGIVNGFAGMRTYDGMLSFSPVLPASWQQYSFRLAYCGRVIEVCMDKSGVSYSLVSGNPMAVLSYGTPVKIE